jgi:hypothetical protein
MALWGKTDADASRPKYLLDPAILAKAIFVDETEAQQKANHDRGLNGAGWWLYNTYTDQDGNTRYKTELLVAITESAANAGDRADDTKAADATYTITIGTQPANQNTSSGGATFSVSATVTAGGGTLAYQWQKKAVGASKWANVSGATSSSLALTGQLVGNTGDQYRVKVNSAGGAAEVVSDVATLTFVS